MAQAFEYDGIDLTRYGYNVKILGAPFSVPARRADNVVVPGKNGRFYVPKKLDQRVQSLAMWVKDIPAAGGASSEANLLANLDALRGLFARDGQHTLKASVGSTTRTATAEVVSAVTFEPQGAANVYFFLVEFLMSDPLWYAEAKTTVGPTSITMDSQNITVTNAGSYAVEKATITLTGPMVSPTLTIGSVWVKYTGALTAGQSLVLNCANFTAKIGTADMSGNISHEGALSWLPIPVGANTMNVACTGHAWASGTAVKVEFYAPYI